MSEQTWIIQCLIVQITWQDVWFHNFWLWLELPNFFSFLGWSLHSAGPPYLFIRCTTAMRLHWPQHSHVYTGRLCHNAPRWFKSHPAPYQVRTWVLHPSMHFHKGQFYKRKGFVWASKATLDGTTVVFPKLSNLLSRLDFLWPCWGWLLCQCTRSRAARGTEPRARLPMQLQRPLRFLGHRREEILTLTFSIITYWRQHLIRGNYFLSGSFCSATEVTTFWVLCWSPHLLWGLSTGPYELWELCHLLLSGAFPSWPSPRAVFWCILISTQLKARLSPRCVEPSLVFCPVSILSPQLRGTMAYLFLLPVLQPGCSLGSTLGWFFPFCPWSMSCLICQSVS